ncbi:MAG: methionyl-tRNA formyltransferase [Candidatus Pacebacteria bacterium]|nr:methionyl-tRNA formyltransferase [Candidatus Paceibacterota bacterium]
MKIILFGSPEFAAIILKKLVESGHMPAAVVCNPDQPAGRKKIMTSPPVKQIIEKNEWSIKILQPKKLKESVDDLKKIDADLFIVASYAKIISKEIIEMPRLKTIGVHPSLLPKYRGSSPIQSVILNGEKETGVAIYLMDEKIDNGPIITSDKIRLNGDENYESLNVKLAELGAELLLEILPDFSCKLNDSAHKKPGHLCAPINLQTQDHKQATFTKKFATEDGKVDLKKDSPGIIYRKIKALNPDPGVFAIVEANGKQIRLKIIDAALNNGFLEILKVQPEGKKLMAYKEFLAGHKLS